MRSFRASSSAAFAAVLLCACTTIPHVLPPRGAATGAGAMPADPPGVVLGIAFSGGGSRAATFSAAVMRELAAIPVPGEAPPRAVIDRPLYLSSVSGGSLSAAFYAARRPDCPGGMLEEGTLSACAVAFFDADYLPAMNENWEGALIESAIGDAIPRADAMARRWDEKLFHDMTFADLARREADGRAPWLVVNGTSWDSGRRFVFTTLPAQAFGYDFLQRVHDAIVSRPARGVDVASVDRLFAMDARRFAPMTFEEVNADPAGLHLSLAVASSSSVPFLMGPVTLVTHGTDGRERVLHVGDGGMFDNQGIESLAQVMFPKMLQADARGVPRRGLMIVVDAAYPFDGDGVYGREDGLLAMLGKSPARISDIMEQRAKAYQLLLWESLRALQDPRNAVVPPATQLPIVYLRHTDAYRELAANPPAACTQWSDTRRPTEAEMLSALSRIPTRFQIQGACDAALLRESARSVVATHRSRIEAAMRP
jgi:predicted acylesterase/phospholipase RssA